jgi:hypothetical protein
MEKQPSSPFAEFSGEPLEGSGFEADTLVLEEESTELEAEQMPEENQ